MNLNLVLAAVLLVASQATTDATSVPFFIADLIAIVLIILALYRMFGGFVSNFVTVAWIGVSAILLFSVILPTMMLISLRHTNGPATYVHDNPIQIEEAIRFLRQGKNPYTENYTATPLKDWSHGIIGGVPNPAFYHVITLPGHLLISFVSYFPFQWLIGYYDERILYLIAYIIMIFLAVRLGSSQTHSMRFVLLLGLNPFVTPFLIEGRNDILVFVFLLAAALTLQRRPKLSAVFFGLAGTIKMFAWIFMPAYLAALVGLASGLTLRQRLKSVTVPLVSLFVTMALIILPFFAWDPSSFLDDTIGYASGTSPTSYPIHGLGFSEILVSARAIKSITDYYPFWIFQLIALIPMLLVFLPKLYRNPKPSLMVFTGTLAVFLAAYFSRFFNDNYIGFLFLLVIAGFGLYLRERRATNTEHSSAA
ncbi:MAG: DUF2029 domain-containing protein [Candidatus Kerfeldbacteria bacterium]|nr:DUF2029 domain-containing protein [Candidatus Kerfeldbacteria bacterium]